MVPQKKLQFALKLKKVRAGGVSSCFVPGEGACFYLLVKYPHTTQHKFMACSAPALTSSVTIYPPR